MQTHLYTLPKVTIKFPRPLPDKTYTLVAGGRAPSSSWFQKVCAGELWAIDRGLDFCHRVQRLPAQFIGDGDSASPESLAWAKAQGLPLHFFPTKKDYTDTQLALQRIEVQGNAFTLLTGCWGGRWDHAETTLASFSSFPLMGVLADEHEVCMFLHGDGLVSSVSMELQTIPETISLVPMTEVCEGITLRGTYWELEHATLRRLVPQAICNVLKEGQRSFSVQVQRGILAVYLYFPEEAR